MAFNPTSTIYLCNVPIDNTYKNQITFTGADANERRVNQYNFFKGLNPKPFQNYLTVRKTLPNGSLQSSVKVDSNIDDLYGYNYMFYQNQNHGTRWFYAFITKLIYINEGTTEIVFETDVWQTWLTDIELKESFVVREHLGTSYNEYNIVPEKFNIQDFEYEEIRLENSNGMINAFDQWGYLITSSEPPSGGGGFFDPITATEGGRKYSGVYQGLYFFYFTSHIDLNDFIEELDQDSIISITCIPEFNIQAGNIGITDEQKEDGVGFLWGTDYPAEETMRCFPYSKKYEKASPKNGKLYTAPFYRLLISNNNGEIAEYDLECFGDASQKSMVQFKMYGDISVNPTVTLIPLNYKGIEENVDCSISLTNFPQCSFNADAYKLWLAKNQYGQALKIGVGTASMIAPLVGLAMATTPMIGPYIGGLGLLHNTTAGLTAGAMASIGGGAMGVASALNGQYQASIEPNIANIGSPKNNLLTAMGKNKFVAKIQRIKSEYAKMLDDYFSMYGYQTNELKIPNIDSRPYYNYVQTSDCNIIGGIPDEDMRVLKSMFNNGVTFWRSTATVGDYSVYNGESQQGG